jgi:3-phenylpropionate/trans-cinnamate dioxygenase ferredoxin reductase subunit
MAYRTIVVGTDGSPTASVAQRTAMSMARWFGAELIVATAYDPPRITREMAERFLGLAVETATREGVRARSELRDFEPAEVLVAVAEDADADLIVVGNRGMGVARRFRMGSVAERVAHQAPCDLLIVDTVGEESAVSRGSEPYRHLLVATDGSPTATEAARVAFDLAMLVRSQVTLLYVGDPLLGAIRLEDTERIAPEGVQVNRKIQEGDPAETIVTAAEGDDVDLVVVGNKGMTGARRFLNSIPNKVAHYSPTDVLIVKTTDRLAADVEPGQGAVVDVDGKKVAVYRNEEGRTWMLDARCTHMGCTVGWNPGDETWDCPCHGSRFHHDGAVLQGPAARPLAVAGAAPQPAPQTPVSEATPASPVTTTRSDQHIVIVGAGLSGATAAVALRDEGFDGRITLVGAEAQYPYERPPLSKGFLQGKVALEEALVKPARWYGDHDVTLALGTTVVGLDPAARELKVAGAPPLRYDQLLIATGARNRRFPIPGLDLPGVYDLRTAEDAAAIRAEVLQGRRAVMAGMGFIGSEVAASLRVQGVEVAAIDGGSVPLERVLGEEVGRVLADLHVAHGVDLHPRDRLQAFEGDGRVQRAVTANGATIECDMAIAAFGVQPNVEWLEGSGVALDDGVLVDERCRSNVEGVFATGDVANHLHPVFGRRMRVEHWKNAIEQGKAAARSMLGRDEPYDEIHWFWSDQYDRNLQYAGHHTTWDDLVFRGNPLEGSFSAYYLEGGVPQAVVAVDRATDVDGAIPLIRARKPVDRAALADVDTDLAALR